MGAYFDQDVHCILHWVIRYCSICMGRSGARMDPSRHGRTDRPQLEAPPPRQDMFCTRAKQMQ
eukprot:5111818-Amphidinium_carterae.2